MEIPFTHRQSAHCETGVTSNLLQHHGMEISEALAFGMGTGIFFGYLPFIRLNHLPLTTFRIGTGGIMNRVMKRLGVGIKWEKFRNPEKAMDALDGLVSSGIPAGCRTGAFWLSYFPRRYRFHFNMHNLVVYGKEEDDYLISDPVFPEPVRCPAADLKKARFAKGALAPKGTMYHLTNVPENPDMAGAVIAGIREACKMMRRTPIPLFGTRGIHHVAKKIRKWPDALGEEKAILYLGQMIRMQEEIGTGGAGFRFIYAAFLQEAAEILHEPALRKLSVVMTEIGDRWRDFALTGSRICKNRASGKETWLYLADILDECGDLEHGLFTDLETIVRPWQAQVRNENENAAEDCS